VSESGFKGGYQTVKRFVRKLRGNQPPQPRAVIITAPGIGRLVHVQWDELFVRILDPNNGLLLREHVRQKRGWYRIKKEDHPKQRPLRVSQLLWRAGRAGTHIGTLCNLIYNQLGEVGVRRVLGVLALAKKFGLAAVEEACAVALEIGVYEYRFVRRYLERGPQLSLKQVDPLIRELVQYRDLIKLHTLFRGKMSGAPLALAIR
jgi:hypothetical protein